uniref:Uncharacterized protein n=1 Tax=Megaselia scalaris TaxID=36166 RepID=T1GWD3_MEGSC
MFSVVPYLSPIALENTLRADCYINFLKLSAAIKILSDENLLQKYKNIARKLIYEFVVEFEEIYGLEHCSSNLDMLEED